MENTELINKIKEFFDKEVVEKHNALNQFSNDVVDLAYQKMIAGLQDMLQAEEDPMVISEILANFLNVTKMVDERGLSKQQLLLKYFEQLSKYEQSRYY